LHSLRQSKNGVLVAATGVDAALEVAADGAVLWEWWAMDHGLLVDGTGSVRRLDRADDHRGLNYDTLLHTTHLNAVDEWSEQELLASLYHQGCVIRISRGSGDWQPVYEVDSAGP
jgi:hypothetical protein